MSSRCLILACSRTKVLKPDLLPAIERYNGPVFKVVRRFLRISPTASSLHIFILSAEHGLISGEQPIAFYDRQMSAARAKALRSQVLDQIQREVVPKGFSSGDGAIFLSMGKVYLEAIGGIETLFPKETELIVSAGSQGQKLTQLKAWLWGEEEVARQNQKVPHRFTEQATLRQAQGTAVGVKKAVVLRGQKVELTHDEALALLEQEMGQNGEDAFKIRRWYVDIAGEKVSPKWAAKHLFNLPVNRFSADEARRVLRQLGFNCTLVP